MTKGEIKRVEEFNIGDIVKCGKVTARIESFPTRRKVCLKNIDYERILLLPWIAIRGHWGMATMPIKDLEREEDEVLEKVSRRKWWVCLSLRTRRDVKCVVKKKVAYG